MTVLNSVLSQMRMIIFAPTPILSNEVSMEPITYLQQFHKVKVGPSIKSSFYPRKGVPEAKQGRDKTSIGQEVNTKPLRPFFNITFYIKGIYRCIKINFT